MYLLMKSSVNGLRTMVKELEDNITQTGISMHLFALWTVGIWILSDTWEKRKKLESLGERL